VKIAGQARGALQQGETVPEFSAPNLFGGRVSWSDYAGKPTVLVIWAPWCPHCQKELPLLGRIAPDYPGVQIVTVATAIGREPGPTPDQLMADSNLDSPTAVDDDNGTLMSGLGVEGFPTSYYVKADGTVMQMTSGETPEDQLRSLFEQVQQP
jgi:thiol-disulfide isomerase/thioredoxin